MSYFYHLWSAFDVGFAGCANKMFAVLCFTRCLLLRCHIRYLLCCFTRCLLSCFTRCLRYVTSPDVYFVASPDFPVLLPCSLLITFLCSQASVVKESIFIRILSLYSVISLVSRRDEAYLVKYEFSLLLKICILNKMMGDKLATDLYGM